MGGAAGHITHLYENDKLTFGEIKDVLSQAAEGKLMKVSEKLDGINLMFTFDPVRGVRVARNTSDIKNGGMSAQELSSKFAGRGNVEDAFNTGYKVLSSAIDVIEQNKKLDIFGNGGKWFSLELIYSGLANTINYDKDHIVFHGWPVFQSLEGTVIQVDGDTGIDVLHQNIGNMQKAIASRNWNVRGPALVRLKKLGDGSILSNALNAIDEAIADSGLDDSHTLQDFIYNRAFRSAIQTGASEPDSHLTASRIAKTEGAPNLTKLKKRVSQSSVDALSELVRAEKDYKKIWIEPIEQAIHDFSIEVLRGLESSLVDDAQGEVERLRNTLKTAITAIQSSGHDESMNVLNTQMQKLKNIENIASPMEGIVFFFKGQAYKFTGAFAPAHQIISLFTYGKGDMTFKPNVHSGGQAFEGVSPITLEQLEHTMFQLSEDLDTMSAFNMKPIGTTGKKSVMNDIDITCEFNGDIGELYSYACVMLSPENVRKVGKNVSFKYPIFEAEGPTSKHVQVDVMPGDSNFIEWSRYAPSPEQTHEEYSPVKGVLRNLLFNQTLRIMSEHVILNETSKLDRKRYAFDFDKGLYIITQTKQGKRKELKNWKTLQREFVSSDPDEIVEIIFGENYTRDNTKTFEHVMHALMTSEQTSHISGRVLEHFIEEVEKFARTSPKFFNDDPWETIDYINSLIS